MTESETRSLVPDRLLREPGPFVSLYLDTQAATEQGDEELALRWKNLREDAAEAGASPEALSEIEGIVAGSQRRGDGLAVIAAADDVVIERYLGAFIRDSITFGPLPDLLPLVEWSQNNPDYAIVFCDRTGADIHVVHRQWRTRTFAFKRDLEHHDVAVPRPGGWAHSRWQRSTENLWEFNSREVAERLGKIVQEEDLDFVLVSGDVSAVRYLKDHASELLREEIIDTGINAHSFDEIGDELERALSGVVATRIKATLERYQEERGQHDLATEGWEDTFAALRMAQVATLLIGDQAQHRHAYFILDDPNQISLDRAELEGIGAGEVLEADAVTVAVRAAVGTDADVCVVPDLGSQHGPKHGIGALLRFKT
ncbi:MAG: hypothetical protein M3277_11855 [Actinomycetota bacterium]|nr:hypothetical protein [Actinomycetota bacterium]